MWNVPSGMMYSTESNTCIQSFVVIRVRSICKVSIWWKQHVVLRLLLILYRAYFQNLGKKIGLFFRNLGENIQPSERYKQECNSAIYVQTWERSAWPGHDSLLSEKGVVAGETLRQRQKSLRGSDIYASSPSLPPSIPLSYPFPFPSRSLLKTNSQNCSLLSSLLYPWCSF